MDSSPIIAFLPGDPPAWRSLLEAVAGASSPSAGLTSIFNRFLGDLDRHSVLSEVSPVDGLSLREILCVQTMAFSNKALAGHNWFSLLKESQSQDPLSPSRRRHQMLYALVDELHNKTCATPCPPDALGEPSTLGVAADAVERRVGSTTMRRVLLSDGVARLLTRSPHPWTNHDFLHTLPSGQMLGWSMLKGLGKAPSKQKKMLLDLMLVMFFKSAHPAKNAMAQAEAHELFFESLAKSRFGATPLVAKEADFLVELGWEPQPVPRPERFTAAASFLDRIDDFLLQSNTPSAPLASRSKPRL